jgi:hypothetical protein
MKIGDIKKFSFGEMTSNNNGKTSATSTAGLYIIFIGGLSFFLGVIDKMFLDKTIDIINQAVMFTTIGAALLGVKNVVGAKNDKAATEAAKAAEESADENAPLNS